MTNLLHQCFKQVEGNDWLPLKDCLPEGVDRWFLPRRELKNLFRNGLYLIFKVKK